MLCRALYTAVLGEQVSKRGAALWVMQEFPDEAPVIAQALAWRIADDVGDIDPEAIFPDTERFVRLTVDRVAEALKGPHEGQNSDIDLLDAARRSQI